MDYDYKAAAIELLRIQTEFNRLKANQQMDGLSQGELFALGCLYGHGKSAYPKNLCVDMSISSARVAVLLNHMEKKGWISRSPDPNDSRQTVVSLTDCGESFYLLKQEEALESIVNVLKKLGEDDTRQLLRIRKKLLNG